MESLAGNYSTALRLIDEAHALDPKTIEGKSGPVPYELHYAQKMTRWLAVRSPQASPTLQLACRAQHFRRFVPSLTFTRAMSFVNPRKKEQVPHRAVPTALDCSGFGT